MAGIANVPESSVMRLSRYHCFVGELLHTRDVRRITSREMSNQLGVSEETVRRDLSYVNVEGRPGAGYDPKALYAALGDLLGISPHHAFVVVGSRPMLEALTLIFPAETFGLQPVAYFSEREADAGTMVDGIGILPLDDIPFSPTVQSARIALVATAPEYVGRTLDLLNSAGIGAVLMLTPVMRPNHPEGMNVTYFRIPCALKSLASGTIAPPSCCVSRVVEAAAASTD